MKHKQKAQLVLTFVVGMLVGGIGQSVIGYLKDPWVCTDTCTLQMTFTFLPFGSEDNFLGVLKIYKKRYTDEYKAMWGNPSQELRDVDFAYAIILFNKNSGHKPNLKILQNPSNNS